MCRTEVPRQELRSGEVRLDGSDVSRLPPHARGLEMVFQSHALSPHMTIERNLGCGTKMRGVQNELRRLQYAVGTTFIYLTHDQEEAMALSDQMVLMRGRHH